MTRNMATLLMADLHPTGGPEIWSGNRISSSIASKIPIQTDSVGCPTDTQPFPPPLFILQKLSTLWKHGVHNWTRILGRAPDGRPYFLDEREFQWANPTMRLPLPHALTRALNYLRVLLSSKDATSWRRLKSMILTLKDNNPSIAPRWRRILDLDWDTLPAKPCPLIVARASRQPTIVEASQHTPPPPTTPYREGSPTPHTEFHNARQRKGFQARPNQQKKGPTHDRPHPRQRCPGKERVHSMSPSPIRAKTRPPQPALHIRGGILGPVGTKEMYTIGSP